MDRVQVILATPASGPGLWAPIIGPHAAQLGEHLVRIDEIDSIKSFGRVRDEAVRILGQCHPPEGVDRTRTGLVIGYVQSGKTMSMTAVSALARDNGIRIVIAISGTTKNLYKQSRERFERDLRGAEAAATRWVMLGNPTRQEHAPEFGRLVTDWRDNRLPLEDKQPLFITVMKNHQYLQSLSDLLATQNLLGIDALIIDDEADQAGLNTRPQDPVASTTYRRIRAIRDRLSKHTYLQYTATPQAVFLISLLDMLSPDFADVLETGEHYTGGRAFFVDRDDLVHVIPTGQLPAQATTLHDPPASLLEAMRIFFLGVAAERILGTARHRSMLVHPDRGQAIQRSYRRWIEQVKARWGDVLRRPDQDEERVELASEFQGPYEELCATVPGLPPLEALLRRLGTQIPQTCVTEVNSDTGSEVIWDNAFAHILVGGQKLDRGYTVKGLTVTYMPRGAGTFTADTIQQRARFFGYKREYLGYCRVFLEVTVRDLYDVYVEHEEFLRSSVVRFRGRSTRELRRVFILDQQYRPTRPNVLTEPLFRSRSGAGWFKQASPHIAARPDINAAHVEEFLRSCRLAPHEQYQHRIARDVPLQDLMRLLSDYAFAQSETIEALLHIGHIQQHLEEHPDAACTVLLMQPDPRKRTTRSQGSDTIELHQGRSNNYPGDADIRDDDRVTLQIHWVRVVDKDDQNHEVELAVRLSALAIYLPADLGAVDWLIQPKG